MRSTSRLLCSLLALSTAVLPGCLEVGDEADPELGEIESSLVAGQWPDDSVIVNKYSTRQVALAPFNNRLYMAHTDKNSSSTNDLVVSSWNGVTWTSYFATNLLSSSRPALTAYNDRLHMIYRPQGASTLRMVSSSGGSLWTTPETAGRSLAIGNYSAENPHATVIGTNLYLTYCSNNGSSSYINIDKYNGTSWTAYQQFAVGYSGSSICQHALLAPMPDAGIDAVELIYGVISKDPNSGTYNPWMYRRRGTIARSVQSWNSPQALFNSSAPVSVVTCNGETHLVHNGVVSPTELWWAYRSNGNWTRDYRVANQWSSGGATLGCLNDETPLMVHNESGSARRLMQSIFAP
ncbi:MAG: hypothetical protein H0T46_35555 [Deltaproteobacteria bacterium]|nr:hypothetical protein [Deltaproteobacteria bacterium]